MLKKLLGTAALAACTVMFVGCDKGSSAGSAVKVAVDKGKQEIKNETEKGKEAIKGATDKGKEAVKDAADALAKQKEAVTSKFTDMTKIEEAIGKLSGDAKTKATEKWTAFKKELERVQNSPDGQSQGDGRQARDNVRRSEEDGRSVRFSAFEFCTASNGCVRRFFILLPPASLFSRLPSSDQSSDPIRRPAPRRACTRSSRCGGR